VISDDLIEGDLFTSMGALLTLPMSTLHIPQLQTAVKAGGKKYDFFQLIFTFGHTWAIATHKWIYTPEEMEQKQKEMLEKEGS
jgi:hypothetical protein